MLKNHADFRFKHADRSAAQYEYLEQYELWRSGDGQTRKIAELSDSHLENLRKHLISDAYRYASEAGFPGRTLAELVYWMKGQPLFLSIEHEKKVRADRAVEMNAKKPTERLYAWKYIDNSVRIVWIRREGFSSYDLVDWFSGQILYQFEDGEDVFGLQRITV